MLGDMKRTHRGFRFYEFKDRNGHSCSLQKSSIATEDCIWLGLDSADPVKLERGKGWVDASELIPSVVELNTRMHLTREQAEILAKQLSIFSKTGELPKIQVG